MLCDDTAQDSKASREFAEKFAKCVGAKPDYAAAHTYDAVKLLIAAIEKAGLNRARIRDALRDLSPYSGVTGTIEWDPSGSNTRPVRLGTIKDGRVTARPQSKCRALISR